MKTSVRTQVTTLAALSVALVALVAAENTARYQAQPNASKMRIDGTSTIHDWYAESALIAGFFEAGADFGKDVTAVAAAKPKVEVTIPVRSLKSSGKAPMDSVMHEAMKQKENPTIKYRLRDMTLKSKASSANGPHLFDTVGELTVSGVTRTNEMVVALEKLADNKVKFTGTNTVKMTDFGIRPPAPALALGLIKTGDDVKVSFEWVVAPANP